MRFVQAGDLRLSVIGLGTWQFGSREWAYGQAYAQDTAPAIVQRAIELGVTLIDTAEIYAFGRSERIVGQAIAGRRDAVVVATKLVPILPVPAIVERQVRGSLRRLGVDAIDLYQVHFPNPFVSARSTMAPLRSLLEQGLVRHVGVSNHSLERWRASEHGSGPAGPDQPGPLQPGRPARRTGSWCRMPTRPAGWSSPTARSARACWAGATRGTPGRRPTSAGEAGSSGPARWRWPSRSSGHCARWRPPTTPRLPRWRSPG